MRKLFLLILTFHCFTAFSQYQRVIKDSTSFMYNNDVFMPIKAGQYNDSIYIQGDTVINSQTYKKVYDKAFCDEPPGFLKLEYNFLGYVREDTIQGKIWRLEPDSTSLPEILIYDISLIKGDSFSVWGKSYAVEIDTIIAGRKHIVILVEIFLIESMKLEFIEGIGMNCNFYNSTYLHKQPNWNYPLGSFLTCVFDGQYLDYKNPTNSHAGQIYVPFTSTSQCNVNCYWIGGKNEFENNLRDYIVYPNPANNEIIIEGQVQDYYPTISILNINGQELIKQTIRTNNSEIDVSTLTSGVYIVKLTGKNTVFVKKIIKE